MNGPRLIRVVAVILFFALGAGVADARQAPHAGHGGPVPDKQPAKPAPKPPTKDEAPQGQGQKPAVDHSAHAAEGDKTPQQPKEPIPELTDADRAAAFPPDLGGHAVHDRAINYMLLFDQFEWQGGGNGGGNWDNLSWIGGDRNRVWLRSEGESGGGQVENAFVDALFGRAFARWWDVVAGVRQDFRPGDAQAWVGGGIQGLAPYWFEVEATGYVGGGGRTLARLEAQYELLLTNRLILQPLIEAEFFGKSDPERGIGAGLSTLEGGLRIRYEFRREFAPYVGLTWNRKLFGTADLARSKNIDVGGARFAVGLRFWF